jgi:hypothetical protein
MASAEHGRPDSTTNSYDVGGKGLLGLLLSQAEQLLSELQAPSAGPKAARRGGRFGKEVEDTASNPMIKARKRDKLQAYDWCLSFLLLIKGDYEGAAWLHLDQRSVD